MTCDRAPSYLGAYVLGGLEPDERAAAEEHLASCAECRDELAAFRGLTARLDQVRPDDLVPAVPSPDLYARVAAAARPRPRPRSRRPRLLVAAAAAVLLVAGGVTWAAVRDTEQVRTATAGPVQLSVAAAEQDDGTALDVTVTGLPTGEDCRLMVVDADGTWHEEGAWTAYGGEASYALWTDVDLGALADVVLVDGQGGELVRVDFSD